MGKKFEEKLTNYWIKHYLNKGHCSLFGNSGIIDTCGTTTAAGIDVGRKNFCICPNALVLRKQTDKVLEGGKQ